jgi:hypothetical protein
VTPRRAPRLRYGRFVLADDWWFWILTGAVVCASAIASGRYRSLAAGIRRRALERRLVEGGPTYRVETRAEGFWSELSWISLLLGAWVAASPWIWGYDDAHGAVPADLAAGAAVVAVTLAGIVFPSLHALGTVAGLWLVLSPWVVGYGDEGGPVGISDGVAGAMISALGVAALATAARRIAPGPPMPVGRVRRPPPEG